MNLEKLRRTLHRELTRNPAKTGTLLALLPVAGYFILPLVWKSTPGSPTSSSPAPAAFVVPQQASSQTAAPVSLNWRELAVQLAQDPRMVPTNVAGLRNPFQKVNTAAVVPDTSTEQITREADVDANRTPEDFGLQLQATIVGAAKRLANINGRLYAENAVVKWPTRETDEPAETAMEPFVVRSVARNYVVLERQGKQFRLVLAAR